MAANTPDIVNPQLPGAGGHAAPSRLPAALLAGPSLAAAAAAAAGPSSASRLLSSPLLNAVAAGAQDGKPLLLSVHHTVSGAAWVQQPELLLAAILVLRGLACWRGPLLALSTPDAASAACWGA
jgi:hypothetical protein